MDSDGDDQINLTFSTSRDRLPTWSPDGSRIAFVSDRDGNSEIYVMNADGTRQRRLTINVGSDSFPAWSPEGDQLIFHSLRNGSWGIYGMNPDGSNQTLLAAVNSQVLVPRWSPNGGSILFTDRQEEANIYVMGADGADLRQITGGPADDLNPVWVLD
jgi:Tol biopolymer transport system component